MTEQLTLLFSCTFTHSNICIDRCIDVYLFMHWDLFMYLGMYPSTDIYICKHKFIFNNHFSIYLCVDFFFFGLKITWYILLNVFLFLHMSFFLSHKIIYI